MKQGKCPRCGTHTFLEGHHILPKSIFGQNEKIIYICSNCHTDFHQKIGSLKSTDKNVWWAAYFRWLTGALLLIISLIVYYYV